MIDAIVWFFSHVVGGIVSLFTILTSPSAWPTLANLTSMEWLVRVIYYGASAEFFFVIFDLAVIILIIGLWRRQFLWGVVRATEGLNNWIGRLAAWAALIMVLQQVMIIAVQRMFRLSEISMGPFGYTFTKDISWFAEELKLYNALIVALCAAYTFIQGGHVRVDLFYSAMSYRGKRITDMLGSLFFVLPFMTIVWLFGWAFMWRHLITPKVATTTTLEQLERKIRVTKWNVETIGFSPNGFDGYFLFKILLISFAGLMFLQGLSFFYRNLLELIEGPESYGKYLDRDQDLETDSDGPAPAEVSHSA
ncbi:MAG: TRAP transporter small permease subunit [Stappiaceae bacterium]